MPEFDLNKFAQKRTASGSSGFSGYGSSSSKSIPDSGQTAGFSLDCCVRKKNKSRVGFPAKFVTQRPSTSSVTPTPANFSSNKTLEKTNLLPSSTRSTVPQRRTIMMCDPPQRPNGQRRRKREDSPGVSQVLKKVSVCMVL